MNAPPRTRHTDPKQGTHAETPKLEPAEQLGWDPRQGELRIVGSSGRLNARHVLDQDA